MKIRILGRDWMLRFVPRLGNRGDCDPPSQPVKAIRIAQSLRGEERLEVILHELVHAAGWHLDENYAEQFAADVARVLWRLGYRAEKK